jgi:tRNA (adenine22-N1)-methyltransferase
MPSKLRIETVLSLLRPCVALADIGTDHALLPVLAVQRGLAQRAIAVDLREGPLAAARRSIDRAALSARIQVVQADGLRALQTHRSDAVVIAGMGGALIERICSGAPEGFEHVTQLLLQPNQGAEYVRTWARASGWHVRDERMVQVQGRYYQATAFIRGAGNDPVYAQTAAPEAVALRLGPLLLQRKDPTLRSYCLWQVTRLTRLQTQPTDAPEPLNADLHLFETACATLS